ncbi:MAG TPA: hypothetical protein VF263_09615, partial [Longimicrobiaceae bacterium]
MRIRNLLLLALPLLAACEQGAPLAPAAMAPIDSAALQLAPIDSAARLAYDAPVRDGYLAGADGVRLYYKVLGTGRDTVVVLHGGPGMSMGYLDRDLAPLAHNRTVILYDQRGGGRSQVVSDVA